MTETDAYTECLSALDLAEMTYAILCMEPSSSENLDNFHRQRERLARAIEALPSEGVPDEVRAAVEKFDAGCELLDVLRGGVSPDVLSRPASVALAHAMQLRARVNAATKSFEAKPAAEQALFEMVRDLAGWHRRLTDWKPTEFDSCPPMITALDTMLSVTLAALPLLGMEMPPDLRQEETA
jgi:hypothetical protein